MPLVVAEQVAQCESVMRDDVVDRLSWGTVARLVQIRRAAQAQCKITTGIVFVVCVVMVFCDVAMNPKTAHRVTKVVIPLQPTAWELTDLVTAMANVPRLGDHFHA